ncbi:MAG: hypothetical protein AB1499_15810, partial [Nitrospirota bacterium]
MYIPHLSIAGIILNICYLPGLCVLTLTRKSKLLFEDLVIAFPVSVGLSSVLILGLLFAGVSIQHIYSLIQGLIGIAVVYQIVFWKRNKSDMAVEITKAELIFALFALIMTLLLSVPLFLGANRLAISAHAFHHSLLVTQILNGIFPPENPGLGGTIIGYYWGFHALVAALAVKSDLQQLQIMFMINAVSLYFIFCVSYGLARNIGVSESYCYIVPFAIIGLMRVDAGVFFLMKLFTNKLGSITTWTATPVEPYEVLSSWISGLPWTDTRQFTLHKLYNVSGMQLAINLCYSYLFVLFRRESFSNKIYMIIAVLIVSACFINYPPLAIFILFFVPMWTCYVFISDHGNIGDKIRQASRIAIPYIIAGLIVAPYMLFIMAARKVSSGDQGGIFSFDFYDQSVKNLVVFIIPLPIIAYGVWGAVKKFSLSREIYFLAIGSGLCLVLTVFTRWPFDNSYKYNYILTLFLSMYFAIALSDLAVFITGKWVKRLSTALILVSLLFTPVMVESSHIVSSLSTEYYYSFKGKHIIYAQDRHKNEAYEWLRENTPTNAILMLSYTETNWPCCGFNNNYEPAAIAERGLYVIKDEDYTVSNPAYKERLLYRNKLFENPEDPSVSTFFSSLGRPVYLLLEDDLDKKRFFVEKRFSSFP